MIYRSRVGRALLLVKAHPDAAASAGIAVARTRVLAYAMAGAYAGFAGALTALWVQRLTPAAFPLSRSFTFLIIVALAGRGFVGGVAAATAAIEGVGLFVHGAATVLAFAGPIGLITTLTRNPAGLNGLGRSIPLGRFTRSPTPAKDPAMNDTPPRPVRPLLVAAAVSIAVGLGAITLSWYHAGNTDQVWIQNQELLSGGLGGLALVIIGVGLFVADVVVATQAAQAQRWQRLLEAIERSEGPAIRPVERPRRRAMSA
jgi:hypothetical protein